MLHAARKYQKSAAYVLVALLILGIGFSTMAQFSDNAYVVRTVHIFPSEVSSNGWQNAETLNFQNLDEYALLQDFNSINSATLSKSLRVVPTTSDENVLSDDPNPAEDESQSATDEQMDTQPDLATSTQDDRVDDQSVEQQSETVPATNTPQTTDVSASEPEATTTQEELFDTQPPSEIETEIDEQPAPEEEEEEDGAAGDSSPAAENGTTTVLREVRSLFAYAVDTLTETFSSTSPAADEVQDESQTDSFSPTSTQEVAQESDVTFGFVNDEVNEESAPDEQTVTSTESEAQEATPQEPTQPVEATTSPATSTATLDVAQLPESVATTSPAVDEQLEETTTTSQAGTPDVAEFDLPVTTTSTTSDTDVSDCGEDCTGHVLRLGNFGYPLDDGVEISGAQLRVSFAAKHKQIRDTLPFFTMNYSFDGGATWSTGGSIVIDDEVSNSINGGYFLFALPAIDDSVSLTDLQVELRYDDEPALLSDLFVESAWLELFVLEPPSEPTTPEFEALLEDDGFIDTKLSGDRLVVSENETIDFTFTDENSDETLIVKSSRKTYDGLSQTTTYFNVTNTSDQSDDFTVQTYFPQNMGEVTELSVFNLNKPRNTVIPEYRPYVYHCEAGWDLTDAAESLPASITDLSIETASGTQTDVLPSSTTTAATASTSSEATTTDQVDLVSEGQMNRGFITEPEEDAGEVSYSCGVTNVVRTCESLEGDNTACVVTQKVRDHDVIQYAPGWESVTTNQGEMDRGSVLKRAAAFLGFGPDRKDVPDSFEGRVYTDGTFSIAPGETRYFKMDISYPAFSSGEYWIEVIGDDEYGLLDPFWSSLWRYRKPITIDNTSGPELTEQQFFLELDSAASGFWANVQSSGDDIRFVRETPGNDLTWWDTNWEKRVEIIIPAASVDADLTDFPVYVDLSTLGSDFFTDVAADGRDIRILDDAGIPNEQAYDLVAINTGAETGELHFKAASLSSTTDNVFYLYFDNPSASAYTATDTYGSQAVWNNNFDLRYALDDNPASSGLQLDSTSNGNDATSYSGMTSGDVVAGQIGQAINHDGNDGGVFGTSLPYTGEFTASMWWRSSGDGFAVSKNAGADEKFGSWAGGNVFARVLNGGASDTSVSAPADGTWAHVVLTRDSADKVDVYLDGVRTRLFGDAAQGGISEWENFGGQTVQGFRGDLDELRFASVKRSDGWISTEFNNQSDPGSFYATTSVESLVFGSFVELDHWVQHFDSTTQEADIWVQVDTIDAAASTTIQLYYGNATAESTSDEYAPFTYSTTTDLYYVMNDTQTSDIVVYSLIDNNEVSIDGGTPVTLQSGETTSFTSAEYASTSVISALGPITARSADDAADNVVPISFASTTLVIPSTRDNEQFFVHAPFSTASVELYDGGAGLPLASQVIASGATYEFANAVSNPGILESDEPILSYFRTTANGDSLAAYPPTIRPVYGINSTSYFFATAEAGGDVNVFCSGGVTGNQTSLVRGTQYANIACASGAQGTGNAVRLVPDTSSIAAIQQADSDGRESSMFLPEPEFGTRYLIPQAAEYISIVCSPRFGSSIIEVQSAVGTVLDSGTCNAVGNSPGALNFNLASPYPAGSQIVSTNKVPFYIYYEDNGTGDETNTWSAVQAKKYNSLYASFTVGAQEVNTDAQYEQNNFRWYENTNGLTPSDSWPGEDGATLGEGEAIVAGAVNPNDQLRLRMNLLANNGTGTVDSTAFVLQYAQAEVCSSVVDTAWVTVPAIGSTTAPFTGYSNPTVTDGVTLPSSLLSDTDVLATYEEQNISSFLPNQVDNGQAVEFDWSIEVVDPVVNTEYCFRMVRASTGNLSTYTVYPQLLTAGPPEQPSLQTPFDNEHATSTLPYLTFVASDVGGDALDYEIEIATDENFTSIIESTDSGTDPFDFENLSLASDKAPFNNGQIVRYLITNPLTDGQTYWWRVRAIDTNGSNTYGLYSNAQSFTINTGLTVSEWFQTTDAQFDTSSLTGVRSSGSGSVELDLVGSNLVGEYGTTLMTNGATSTVTLSNSYTDPVVVASIRYSKSVPNDDQVAARVSNKTGTSFDLYTDNYNRTAPGTSTVDYIVMEAGEYIIDDGDDGLQVFATSTSVSAYDGSIIASDPGGLDISFPTTFSGPPVVMTMVTTVNDPDWVVSTPYDGNSIGNAPSASLVSLFLNDNVASDGHLAAEDIDMIAFDKGNGTNNGVPFDIGSTGEVVTGVPAPYTFLSPFASVPGFTGVSMLTTNGAQGGYAMVDVDTPATVAQVTVASEEGGPADRNHAAEDIGVVAFENASGDITRTGIGRLTSAVIDYDDVVVGNAWGEVSWNDSGDVVHRVQYNTGSGFENVPDSDLPGNSAGFTTSPINILSLDTDVYNELRLTAEFSGVDPELFDWRVTWGQRVEVPELGDPYDNEKTADTTPTFDFATIDPQGDALDYEISYSTDPTFETSSTTIRSDVDFTDFNGGSAGPYASGATVTYTIPAAAALLDGETYWWRVRAKDPAGSDAYSPWSQADNFTVDTATTISTWFQTTRDQFQEGVIDGVIASTSDSVELSNVVGEYGTTTVTGNGWQTITTQSTYDDMVVVASTEYPLNSLADGRTVQVRNKTRDSFEIKVDNYTTSLSDVTEVNYIVMAAGDWVLDDGGSGMRVVAGTASDVPVVNGRNISYAPGAEITFSPAFTATPGALSTVSTANGSKWVHARVDNGTEAGEVTASQMHVSLGVGTDVDVTREAEDIDYIAFAPTAGTNSGVLFDAFNSADSVTHNPTAIPFNQTFTTAPEVVVVQNNGMDGGDGGSALQDTRNLTTATTLYASIAEHGPAAGGHTAEIVSVFAFADASGSILRDSTVGGGLSGSIASEEILFSDGAGPKFDRAVIGATTPGASAVTIQVEYQTATGSWALIPDGDFAGNSTGFTSATVDLSTIDVGTYQVIRLRGTLNCDASDCPTLDDWAVEWSEGVEMSGTLRQYDRTSLRSGTSPFDPNWLGRLEVTIDAANIDDTLVDFPVFVDLADMDAAFWSGVQSDGRDIRVTTADESTEVPIEVVSIDTGTQSGELYFKAPSLSSTTDTTFYIYYNNAAATAYAVTDTYGRNNVWTEYEAVLHLNSTTITDSTGNGYNGTNNGASASTEGGRNVLDFNGVSDYITLGDVLDMRTDDLTISANAVTTDTDGSIIAKSFLSGADSRYALLTTTSGGGFYSLFDAGAANRNTPGQTGFSDGTARHFVARYDRDNNNELIVDGVSRATIDMSPESAVDVNAVSHVLIGRYPDAGGITPSSGNDFDGKIWNVRFAQVALSDQWLAAESANQLNPSGFYSVAPAPLATVADIAVAVNGAVQGSTGSVLLDGSWSVSNVTAFAGDVVTVFVSDAVDSQEAVGVFVYDGLGDMTGVELFEGHVSISSNETTPITLSELGLGDSSAVGDEDVFYEVDAGDNLDVCGTGTCDDANLYVGPGNSFVLATSGTQIVRTHDFVNDGTVAFDNSTLEVSGSWFNNATTSIDTSTVIFTATTSSETLTDADSLLDFHNVTFGQTSGSATWTAADPIDVGGTLAVDFGTLDRSTQPITVAGVLTTGAAGFWSGVGTTTFDGSGSAAWTDVNLVPQNIGNVVIDGASRTVVVGSDVRASSILIGANDRLNAGGSNDIFVSGNFTNNNQFTAQSSQLVIDGAATNAVITTGGSNLFALRASSSAGSIAFTESAVTLLGDFSIATGTVTLPTDVLNIAGSFTNESGVFAHNNAEVNFTGAGSKTIALQGTAFLNGLYDVRFSGSGDWTFLDTAATTTNTWTQTNGSVTLPSGTLTVGRNYSTTGSGSFVANGGEVVFLARSSDTITTNGSEFHDVRIREGSPVRGGAFDAAWLYRDAITINAAAIDDDLIDFPVYLDLADFDPDFFANLNADGGDIRITQSDGVTEVPREIVAVDTGAQTGEVYFKAPTLASSTNTTFYIYYGNSGAADYAIDAALGAENVWDDDFLAVYHMESEDAADSTSFDRDATAVGTTGTTAGQIGTAVSITDTPGDDYIDLNSSLTELNGGSQMTISTWVNVSEDGSDDVLFATQSGTPILWWDNISGSTNNDTYSFSVGSTAGGNRVDGAPTGISVGDSWQYVTASMQGGTRNIYVDGALSNTRSGAATTIPTNTGGSNIGRWQGSFDFGGLVDEFRISAIERSAEWIAAEFTNMDNTSGFYTITSGVGAQTRAFADTDVTIGNDLVIESARAQFPTGNLFIGGSFDNNSEFTNSNGTVVFNATSTGNTVAASSSVFYDLTFDGVGGGWNVIENATATNAIELSNGDAFTVDSGVILESTGTFFTQMSNASTTWTGSTLLLSGADHEINDKAGDGDEFATLSVVGDTDIRMWNSTALTYDTQDTGSIYSQDHAGSPGDLYIFGDYERSTGTEYWNYATDFDGTVLTGGSERQANVRIANGGQVAVTGSALQMLGAATASTTVDAQSGSYTWVLDDADLAGEYFTATGGDAAGLQLLGSTTMSTFTNAEFTIPTAAAAISLSSTTIDQNPATQFFNIDFVSGGGSINVDLLDTPTSFWWLRDGVGDRYGENFDNGDGNPGSVRWDDSNYQIDISGVVYAPNKTTPLGGPTCDGSTANVRVVVDGGAYTDAVSCDGVTGAYNFTDVSYIGDPVVQVYLDTAGGNTGAVVTKTPTTDIADLDLYVNHTIVRHELTAPITIADLAEYDSSDDSDLPFTAATGSTPSLVTNADTALYVWPNKTFAPGGSITLAGDGGANSYEGTLELGASATFVGASTTYSLAGSLLAATGASFDIASSTFIFNATTTGKVINSSSTIAFNQLQFTGSGGTWSLDSNVTAVSDVTVSAGTLQGTGDMTLINGELTGDGSVDMTGGTIEIQQANTFGGTSPWSFNNLTLGSGLVSGVTTPAGSATTTVRDTFTISAAHFYDAGSSVLNLAGDGTVFIETGTFLEDTSTVQYSGATPNVLATPYYNLLIDDNVTSVVAVAPPTGLQILNDLTIGVQGTASLDLTTNDPLTSVAGNLSIGGGGTLVGSDTSNLQVFGDWSNNGTYTANGGTVAFNSPDAANIDPGTSAFSTAVFNGTGPYTMSANATTTDEFSLAATTEYTQQTGTTLAVGGQFINQTDGSNTVWVGTTLSLYGGQAYEINAKTQSDDYETVEVATNTHPRVWNSSISTVNTATDASLYVMDHNDIAGDLYIYGDYVNTSFADSWSYATDFDGAPVTPRQANVYIEGGRGASYNGGNLEVLGDGSASTTIQNFGVGTYDLAIAGSAFTSWQYATPRDLGLAGIEFTGTPTVDDFSYLDLLVEINSASAVTVAGTVIDANPAKNFTNNYFNFDTGVTGAVNVTATGGSVSSWRFTNGFGSIEGESFDADSGNPGEVVWEDSAQEITISGNVYSDEGTTASAICDGTTNNVVLRVAGLTTYTGTCASGTGAYSIPSVAFSANDTLTLYIAGEAVQAANVSIDPASNISNMDLYEDRVIVRHEGANPITIADMAVWDSSDDVDIPFTAVTGTPDDLTLPADTKLIVWNNKAFEPQGNVTVGDAIELFTDAQYLAADTETHSVGASFIAGAGAVLTAAESEFTFTSAAGGQTIDLNEAPLYDVSFTGAGAWDITDPTFTALNDVTISAGAVTLPTGTTTIAGSFDNTGGSFDANTGSLIFTATDGGNTIAFGGSDANVVEFNGIGSWSFNDVNATTSGSFTVATGTVTLPSDTLVVGDDFVVHDTVAHNGGTVQVTGTSGNNIVTLGGNDLTNLTIAASAGDYTLTDVSAALLGDLTLTSGSLTVGTGTVSIGGSFDVSGGTYNNASGTLLFNSADGGEFIDPGANDLYNVVIAGTGGWNIIDNATTTNNFTLANAGSFTLTSGAQLYVGGVFTNDVGGGATTWSGTTLILDGGNEYETNNKATSFESYENLVLGENTDVSSWRSSAASVVVPSTSSWYSQDHSATDGLLRIYGDYHVGTTTEHWSANTDFDGTALGSARAVTVEIASSSAVTVDGGSLQIIGTPAASTTIQNQGSGTYTFSASSGTFNANNYNFNDLDTNGLQFSGSISIPSLSNGYFTQAANGSNLITVVAGVINNNASLMVTDTGFATGGFTGGANVTLDATTTNSWNFTGDLGDFWGEDFDVDGFDACSSIRWDDSDCLLTEQTNYRWRNDDGGEGAPSSTWYDTDWSERQRLRVINDDAVSYTNTAIKLTVPYDADMQTDFEDLRFTSSDGVTLINHWIERVTVSDNAIVWIQLPSMPADNVTEVYMYYGNVVAADSSDGDAVFAAFEDFEDNNISEYSGTPGDLALFSTNSTFAYGGSFGLDTDGNESGRTTNGITRSDVTTEQGQSIRFMQYIDTAAGSGDEVCTIFAATGAPASRTNYAVCVDQVGTDRVSIVEDVNDTENSGTVLGTANFSSLSTGWHEVLIDWETDNSIDVVVIEESSGSVIATTTATDGTRSTGSIGFTYWFQNGGWDSFVAWPRTETVPTVFFGDEQSNGGASWAGAQNTPTGGFAFGDTARLRVSIENSGLPIENQRFRLEYAPKLTAPSCEAVDVADFDPVPSAATCGSDAVCMTTSPNVSDGAVTTDHLVTDGGDFVAGAIVTDPENRTGSYDLDQGRYTEIEYALNLTVNATNDSYCFRVTNNGSSLDAYSNLPELTLAFDPVITNVSLNDGSNISLIPGTTTIITASSTVTDFNGIADLVSATTTFYTTSAGALCTPDDNNCYVATSSCLFTNCSGTSCSLQCTAPFAFHANPTDDPGDPDEWFAFMEVSDTAGGTDFEGSNGVELFTIRALDVQNDIGYGSVDINDDTGSFNPMVSLVNIGNEPIDVIIAGTDMTDGSASVIPAAQQLFATSTFTYSSCIGCEALSVTGSDVEVDLPKPMSTTPSVTDDIYWGIAVPFGTNSAAHTGVNTFTAISD